MTIKVASAQYPITEHRTWEDWQIHLEQWVLEAVNQQAQVLLFPEYGSMELVSLFDAATRADIHAQVKALDALKADFCDVFAQLATKYQVIIVAPSLPVIENEKALNRAFVFSAKGLAGYQDKFFMTRFENEEWYISSAPKVLSVFEAEWGSFGIQICYDVEFALGSQQLCAAGANLILVPSCTETIRGATRVHVGARARALENQAYTVVSQTVGNAPWSPAVDINYGYAGFYSSPDKNLPEEGIVALGKVQAPEWTIETLDMTLLDTVRTDGQVFNYKDHQTLLSGFSEEAIQIQHLKL